MMRKSLWFVCCLAIVAGLGCGQPSPTAAPAGAGDVLKIKIKIKKVAGVCQSRTMPRKAEFEPGDYGQIRWVILDPDNCLTGDNLELRFDSGTPMTSACSYRTTNADKTKILCTIDPAAATNTNFKYNVFRITANDKLEDPDIEIVTF